MTTEEYCQRLRIAGSYEDYERLRCVGYECFPYGDEVRARKIRTVSNADKQVYFKIFHTIDIPGMLNFLTLPGMSNKTTVAVAQVDIREKDVEEGNVKLF